MIKFDDRMSNRELIREISQVIPEWAYSLFPDQPFAFLRTPDRDISPWCYKQIGRARGKALFVICTAHVYGAGERWVHVSCSTPNALPTWEELKLVKNTFIGEDKLAIQVLPPKAKYVNKHDYVLHLWHRLDSDPIPDFTVMGHI